MEDVFELQDEIARKIAEALRVTLSPAGGGGARGQADGEPAGVRPVPAREELRAPTHAAGQRVRAPDVRERRRAGPRFALAHAAIANVCAADALQLRARPVWLERARAASRKAVALRPELPEPRSRTRGSSTPTAGTTTASDGAPGDREEERLRGRVLPARAHAVLGGPLPGARGRGGEGDGGGRAGLQHLRPDPERARRARQDRGAARTSASARSRRSRTTSGRSRRTRAPGSSSRATTPSPGEARTRSARRTSRSRCGRTRPRSSTTRRASSARSRTRRRRSTR